MKQLFDSLTEYYLGDNNECSICFRDLPNKNMKTKKGCVWCDPKGDK